MSQPNRQKAVEASGGNKTGIKRQADKAEAQASTKKLKAQEEQIFRFLDLPGETRNHIYEICTEITERTWPFTNHQDPRKRGEPKTNPEITHKSYPFLGLTQSCSTIRAEFRGLWMKSHKVPLCAVNSYFTAFFPPRPKKEAARFESYYNKAGRLRIHLRQGETYSRNLLRLARHKAKYPKYTIEFEQMQPIPGISIMGEDEIRGIHRIINNTNPKWIRWIRSNAVSIIEIHPRPPISNLMRIVVKERFSCDWMKPMLKSQENIPKDYLATLGLDNLEHWTIGFAVDYS